MTQFIEVQEIAGRRVRDAAGVPAGRIQAIRAEKIGPQCVIHEYHLGTAAFLSRLGMSSARLFGISTTAELLRVPWKEMDLSNPSDPRLRCTLQKLRELQSQLPPFDDDSPPKRMIDRD